MSGAPIQPITCPLIQLVPSIIWAWSDWTQAGRDWLCDWMAFVSVSPWWTVSRPGGQTSDPDESHDVCPAHAQGVRRCESVPALCSVSCPACLCMSLNTDINIQRSASCEPRVTAGRLNHCDHDGQTPDTGLRGQLVAGKLCQCLDNDNVVSDDPGMCHTLICHFIWTDIWSRQWHAERLDFINNLLLL